MPPVSGECVRLVRHRGQRVGVGAGLVRSGLLRDLSCGKSRRARDRTLARIARRRMARRRCPYAVVQSSSQGAARYVFLRDWIQARMLAMTQEGSRVPEFPRLPVLVPEGSGSRVLVPEGAGSGGSGSGGFWFRSSRSSVFGTQNQNQNQARTRTWNRERELWNPGTPELWNPLMIAGGLSR